MKPVGYLHHFSYSYDKAGNILSDGQKNYAYDEIYRLLSATGGVKNEAFAYDKAGNRMSNTKENLNSTYKTNTLNQYLNQRNELPAGNIQEKNFKYDKNGNLIEDEKQKYEYDYKNKLIRVTDKVNTGKITEFVYDVLGRRIEKKVGNIQTISYTYSNENILIEQTQRDEKTYTKRYVNGIGTDEVLGYENESLGMNEAEYHENIFCKNTVLPNQTDFEAFGYTGILNRCAELSTIANNSEITKNVYYFGKDHLGNIVSLTNETGKLLLKYEYDSYGKVYVKSGSGFTEIEEYQGNLYENARLFTGREFDKEIGLYYYRARYYSAALGRFISRDPIAQNDDVNLYAYVGNNSVMFVDLMGLACDKKTLTVIYRWSIQGGHMSVELDDYVYTYVASGENRYSAGISSIIIPTNSSYAVSADIERLTHKDYFDIYGDSVHTTHMYYISEEQENNIQDYINNMIQRSDNKYNLLGSNCSTFVQACLYIGGLKGGIDETNLLDGIPAVYNKTLINIH